MYWVSALLIQQTCRRIQGGWCLHGLELAFLRVKARSDVTLIPHLCFARLRMSAEIVLARQTRQAVSSDLQSVQMAVEDFHEIFLDGLTNCIER